jgi:tetratricopeptide (TPR) repeat protein
MKKVLFFVILVALSGFMKPVWAQSSDAFQEGNKAYNEGNYSIAIQKYESVLDAGEHSDALYFNLGNAYYKLDDIANSIYYYEKALLLSPEDIEIKENLAFAQNMAIDSISGRTHSGLSNLYSRIVYALTLSQWALLSIVFMMLFVLLYVLFLMGAHAKTKRLAFTLSAVFLAATLASFTLGYSQKVKNDRDLPAIVFQVTSVQSEPNDRGSELFNLHPGTKVQILDELGSWYKIEIADGQQGWLPMQSVNPLKE